MTAPLPTELAGWTLRKGTPWQFVIETPGPTIRVTGARESAERIARFLLAAPGVAAELERMTALIESHLDEKGNWKARTP